MKPGRQASAETRFPVHPVAPERVETALKQLIYRDVRREVRVRDVIALLQRAGMRVFIAGGAPRDWLIGKPARDIDLSLDRPVEEAHRLLREAYPDIDPVLLRAKHFGLLRWGDAALAGGLDLNILRSPRDLQDGDMWTTLFVARQDLREDALTRDFSVNAFYYDCQGRVLVDPLGCGLQDLRNRTLRLINHPHMLASNYRITFRILQFLCRGYGATPPVLEYLERSADNDIQTMGERLAGWIANNVGSTPGRLGEFERRLRACARREASRQVLDSVFAMLQRGRL